jgi:hypothetical protein
MIIRNTSRAQAEMPIPIPVFAAVERRELPPLLEEEAGPIIWLARRVVKSRNCRYRMFERETRVKGWT